MSIPAYTPPQQYPPYRILVTGGCGFLGRTLLRQLHAAHPNWQLYSFDKQPPPPAAAAAAKSSAQNGDAVNGHAQNGIPAPTPATTEPPLPPTTYLTGSMLSRADVAGALAAARPHAVVHTAGLVPPLGERYGRRLEAEVRAVNVEGTRLLLELLEEVAADAEEGGLLGGSSGGEGGGAELLPRVPEGVQGKEAAAGMRYVAFVWTSSCCVVVDDCSRAWRNVDESVPTVKERGRSLIYGESKAAGEEVVLGYNATSSSPPSAPGESGFEQRRSGLLTCSIRPCVLFGPGDYQLVPTVHSCIAKRETPFCVGDGLNLWDVADVRNAAHAHLLALENLLPPGPLTAAGEAFFIANNAPIPFRDFCRAIWAHFGHYPPWWSFGIPQSLALGAAWFAEKIGGMLGLPVTFSTGSVRDACAMRYCDEGKAKKILGYVPLIGLVEGLRESCLVRPYLYFSTTN